MMSELWIHFGVFLALAIVVVALFCCCCCCCYWLCFSDRSSSHKQYYGQYQPLNQVELGHRPEEVSAESDEDTANANLLTASSNEEVDYASSRSPAQPSPSETYTEDEAIEWSAEYTSSTYLLTSTGRLYVNSGRHNHAESIFINELRTMHQSDVGRVKWIKIKNSPCSSCSCRLVEFYSSYTKPAIYFGSIYRNKTTNEFDKDAIEKLLKAGFQVDVWEKMHTKMYGRNSLTHDILKEIKNSCIHH